MHDGRFEPAIDVAVFYIGGGRDNQWLSPLLRAIGPAPRGTTPDVEGLNAFVRALTGGDARERWSAG